MIAPEDLRALDIAERGGLGLAKLIEVTRLFGGENEPRTCRCSGHVASIAPNDNVWICFNETQYYVLWGGREGYDSLLNTDLRQEKAQLGRFLRMVVEHKHKIGCEFPANVREID